MAELRVVAGIDEAGRGPLAGPVVAAAVILNDAKSVAGLRDSKRLSIARRECLYNEIISNAVSVAVGVATVEEIDAFNILQATLLAMRRAVQRLTITPTILLVDGNQDPGIDAIETRCIVRGDVSETVISAASIVAKVTRDRMMTAYDDQYPDYGFAKHKGYGTAEHLAVLRRLGPTKLHRRSFAPVKDLC